MGAVMDYAIGAAAGLVLGLVAATLYSQSQGRPQGLAVVKRASQDIAFRD